MKIRKLLPVLFWLAVWQLGSMALGNPLLLASPLATGKALLELLPQGEFWLTVGSTLGRISLGFGMALVLGILAGAAGWRFPLVGELLSPVLTMMKTVPVASFVILALVWFGSKTLSIIVSFLIVFPQIYFAAVSGLACADAKLQEMASVFRFPPWRSFWEIYRPPLVRSLTAACSSALGMSWKSGVAAEVIGTPAHSIGEALYLSKVYMMTAELFAWTAVIVALSAVTEKCVLLLLKKAGDVYG